MSAGAPWSVKGIDPKAREVAKDHARRSGMTLGEWLNRVILDDELAAAGAPPAEAYAAPEAPRAFAELSRPRLVAEAPSPRPDELARIAHALDRLTDRIEASETRTGLAVSGVEHSVRQAVARIEAAERETLAVAARFDGAADRLGDEQARLAERLRRFETDAAGPRSTEALRAIEQSVGRIAGQVYDVEARARDGLTALEERLARAEARAGGGSAPVLEALVQRLGDRVARAETHTGEALDALRRSLAVFDDRLRGLEGGRETDSRRFEALAESLTQQLDAARAQVAERLKAVDAGRVDRRFAELAAEVKAAEQRSAHAVQRMGREVLTMADALNRRLQSSEDRHAEAIGQVGGEMARVAEAMEARLGRAEQVQSQALDRLSGELGRITDKLSDRLLVSERRAAEAIDDVGEQVSRVTERMAQSQERAALELGEKIRESEQRTAQLLEETRSRLEQRLGGAAANPPPTPPAAAFGPELFSRAEEADEEDLELVQMLAPFAPAKFQSAEEFAPLVEPEDDLFGLDQPEPPPEAEAAPALSTREVIEQARAAARAAAPAEGAARLQVKARASWRSSGKPAGAGGGLFGGMRPRRAPTSTLQTALMVAGGAAFLSVGAAGVVLMQGPPAKPAADAAPAPGGPAPRAAVALASPGLAAAGAEPTAPVATARPPARLAHALSVAYASAAKDLQAGDPGALARLRAIAEAGHPPAQFYLGKLYEIGEHGVKQDLVEARRWTERAAEGGDAAAMHNLALFEFRGEGGAQDLAGAARWFRAAAERGIVDSQYNLGLLYESGNGVPQDPARAYAWFSVAAASGDVQSRTNARQLAGKLSPRERAAADQLTGAFAAQARKARSAAHAAVGAG